VSLWLPHGLRHRRSGRVPGSCTAANSAPCSARPRPQESRRVAVPLEPIDVLGRVWRLRGYFTCACGWVSRGSECVSGGGGGGGGVGVWVCGGGGGRVGGCVSCGVVVLVLVFV